MCRVRTRQSNFIFCTMLQLWLLLCEMQSVRSAIGSGSFSVEQANQLEASLLSSFGLSSRPKPRGEIQIPDYLVELYGQQTGMNLETTHLNVRGKHVAGSNTVRSFTSSSPGPGKSARSRHYVKFDLKNLPVGETVRAAELRLKVTPPAVFRSLESSGRKAKLSLQVFEITRKPTKRTARDPVVRLLDTKTLVMSDRYCGGWYEFDVLPAISRWLSAPSTNFGLLVQLSLGRSGAALDDELWSRHEHWLVEEPILVTYGDDGRGTTTGGREEENRAEAMVKRVRRASNKKQHHGGRRRKGRRQNCKRHTLYVDFHDVGWNDWIVAPPGYHAFFCHGDCPFPMADHLNSTNHAIVQTLVNSVSASAVPRACCVPTKLSPISMLYLDEYDKVVLKNYQDMVVEGCGCR